MTLKLSSALLLSCTIACTSPGSRQSDAGSEPGDASADAGQQVRQVCIEDGDSNGPPCLQLVESDQDFARVSIASTAFEGCQRLSKYMIPVRQDPHLLPPVVQNANRYSVHLEFLADVFADWFPGLDLQQYGELILKRQTRSYYAGNLVKFEDPQLGVGYGFTVYTAGPSSELLEQVEVEYIHNTLSSVITTGKVYYTFEPYDNRAQTKAQSWLNPSFPIYYIDQEEVGVEVYTGGTAYGYVKRFLLEEFDQALHSGAIGWQDLVVIDQVPFDIEAVVAAVVTGGRQWELTHVNVRMARRGTPNFYIRDALETLADYQGQLVRVDAKNNGAEGDSYQITAVDREEAEAWWSAHRPNVGEPPTPELSQYGLQEMVDMDCDDDPIPLVSHYGGKASNLAKLYSSLDSAYQVPAFAIPFVYFEQFLGNNTILDMASQPSQEVSLKAFVSRLASNPQTSSDTAFRRQQLAYLRDNIRQRAQLDASLVEALAQRIVEVFGSENTKVRFRSSSNVEDALEFSGAGLYDSTSVCVADNLDGDDAGPSICDPSKNKERTIERGLRKVWASLFNDRAWEERNWYQIPQTSSSMAILVSKAFADEIANGVAFTGNPGYHDDDRYLINAQLGDESVVGNDPSLVPEKDLLKIVDDRVDRIYRVRSSVLAEPGQYVLSDEQLEELGSLLASINQTYPIDTGEWSRDKVLLDLEFKIDRLDGGLKLKQIRPFLEKCRHVECTTPPTAHCADAGVLVEYRDQGVCDSLTGGCRYAPTRVECDHGCDQGRCVD